ncbi:nucleotidyltransferase family protein [Dinoroseobacter sp. S124A]|uniref:nucleotidyltransferase family protein n=1 Tax=Dinoroseobacter sp. S124A TaxID=3415128 RepID=UPI003C7C33B5
MSDVILILAAGQSRRMGGRDKLLEPVDGRPLVARQAALAAQVTRDVLVALPPRPHARYAALDGLGVTALSVPESAEGMGGSLRGAVSRLPEGCTGLLLLLGDLPEITADDLRAVLAARDAVPDAHIWRGTTEAGAPGHPILFSSVTFPDFAMLEGDEGGQRLIARHRDYVHLVPLPGSRARRDLDTPEDWASWRSETGR